MSGSPVKIAILFSGRGSNMQTLARHIAKADVPAELVLTVTNRPDAGGLEICKAAGIACTVIDHKTFDSREAFDAKLDETLRAANIELICCAGFMRLLTADFVNGWPDRLLNIHPSLLPAFGGKGFYGHRVHSAVLARGCQVSGCTVHLVDEVYDNGPILVQRWCPVQPDDSADTLAARVFDEELRALPEGLARFWAKHS